MALFAIQMVRIVISSLRAAAGQWPFGNSTPKIGTNALNLVIPINEMFNVIIIKICSFLLFFFFFFCFLLMRTFFFFYLAY